MFPTEAVQDRGVLRKVRVRSAILAARVYRNPRPTHISGVMRRVREAVRELDATTLTKLVHEMPAKMQEIYRLKGQKISPGWKAKNSKYACRCSVCSS